MHDWWNELFWGCDNCLKIASQTSCKRFVLQRRVTVKLKQFPFLVCVCVCIMNGEFFSYVVPIKLKNEPSEPDFISAKWKTACWKPWASQTKNIEAGGGQTQAHQNLDILSCKTSTNSPLFNLVPSYSTVLFYDWAYFSIFYVSTRNIHYFLDWRHLTPERIHKQLIIKPVAVCSSRVSSV